MNELIILDIAFKFGDTEDVIHPVVLKDDKNLVLIDCGYTGFLPNIEMAMAEKNLSCDKLTHVVITHQDHDHMGALCDLKQKYPNIKVVAGEKESPYISGELKSLRLAQAEAMQPHLPDAQKEFGRIFCNILKNVKPCAVDIAVHDGDTFDWCGGCTIIETPGHTPGHISVYAVEKDVLITGDAVALENGRPVIANPQFSLDLDQAEASFHKVMAYGAKSLICYHGGEFVLSADAAEVVCQ